MKIGQRHGSLEEYLKGFEITLSVLQTEAALYRTAYELAMDAAGENVRLLEVRYSPVLHLQKGLKPTVVVEAVLEGLRKAERETGIIAGVLVCGIRNMSPETSLRLAELSVAYKNKGVLGFDLAGAEHGNPAKDHQEAFQLILNNNVNCTVHAGEAYGPPSIAQALHYCGRTASATACGCARTATCSITSTTTASRSSAARPRTCRQARWPTWRPTRSSSTWTSAFA